MAQQASSQQAAPQQADVYTVLLLVAIVLLGFTIGMVITDLISNYGVTFGDIFKPLTGK